MAKTKRKISSFPTDLPAALANLFESNLLPGEKPQTYRSLRRDIALAVKPRDVIEYLLIEDFVQHTLQVYRLRLIATHLLRAEVPPEEGEDEVPQPRHPDGLRGVLKMTAKFSAGVVFGEAPELRDAKIAAAFERLAEEHRDRLEEEERYGPEHLRNRSPGDAAAAMRRAFKHGAADYERVIRLVVLAEQRADTAIREIALHRESLAFARQLGRAADGIVDAEFKEALPKR